MNALISLDVKKINEALGSGQSKDHWLKVAADFPSEFNMAEKSMQPHESRQPVMWTDIALNSLAVKINAEPGKDVETLTSTFAACD